MDKDTLMEIAEEHECLLVDDFEDCILGLFSRFGMPTLVAYDKEKMLQKMVKDGMTYEEAMEYFDYNIIGAWMGDTTPVFVDVLEVEKKTKKRKNAKAK